MQTLKRLSVASGLLRTMTKAEEIVTLFNIRVSTEYNHLDIIQSVPWAGHVENMTENRVSKRTVKGRLAAHQGKDGRIILKRMHWRYMASDCEACGLKEVKAQ